jgi:hypothetical protein
MNTGNIDNERYGVKMIEIFAEIVADKIMAKQEALRDKPRYRDDDSLNTPSAAKYLGKSISTLRNWQKLKKHIVYYINKDTLEVYYKFIDLRIFKERANRISPNG